MTRLLLYSPTSRSEPGGVQAVVARLAASLRARGHEVVEGWAAAGPGASVDEWVLPLEVTTGASSLPAVRSLHRASRSLLRLARGLARRRPQLVNVHFLTGHALYFLALRRAFGYLTVLSIHGSDLLSPSAPCRRYLPLFLRKADAVTVVSEHLRERALAHPGVDPARVHVIPNGIDAGFWTPDSGPRAAGVRRDRPPTIVAVGRLEHVKGYDVLLRAFARVVRGVPAARLVIAGDGTLRQKLAEQAARAGLRDAVDLPGRLRPEEVRALLRDAAAFALPSRSEGMPLALLEAMACGAPAVATRVGGVPEVLTPGAGLLVPSEDDRALAGALLATLEDPREAERLAQEGRRRALALSGAAADAAYEALYARLLDRAPPRRHPARHS